jgi:hypothetical protein
MTIDCSLENEISNSSVAEVLTSTLSLLFSLLSLTTKTKRIAQKEVLTRIVYALECKENTVEK